MPQGNPQAYKRPQDRSVALAQQFMQPARNRPAPATTRPVSGAQGNPADIMSFYRTPAGKAIMSRLLRGGARS